MATKSQIEPLLAELRAGLRQLYGERLQEVLLYGSWARGEAGLGSDVDVMVVLRGRIEKTREIERMLDLIVVLGEKHRTLVSVYPISQEEYETLRSPLLLNARREGVAV